MQVLTDHTQLATVLSPLRMSILEELKEPGSATTLADRMRMPRQKLNYHLRELEREGFLELVEERQRRGCVERYLRATSRGFVVNPALLGSLADDPEAARDRFSSAYLVASASRLIRDVAILRERSQQVNQKLATLTIETEVSLASPAALRGFAEELASVVASLAAKYSQQTAAGRKRRFRVVIGTHPVITKSVEQAAAEAAKHHREIKRNMARRKPS